MPKLEPQLALAWAVRKLRLEKGLTQEELASRAGMHLTWIGRLESGAANPTWASTRRVARGLGVSHLRLAELAEKRELEEARGQGPDAGA